MSSVTPVRPCGRLDAQRPTSNAQLPKFGAAPGRIFRWTLDVERRRHLAILLSAILLTAPSFAADPVLNHLSPAAGQQGTTVSVTAAGKFDPWPAQVWVDAPGITFMPSKTVGKFDVEIAKDVATGPDLVRIFTEHGVSDPPFFLVAP